MKLSEFKKLEESIKEVDFHTSFKNINKVMFALSLFGHVSSIFLAYFLVFKIIGAAVPDNPILSSVATIILLGGLELLKREIFDKFSIQFIKIKNLFSGDVLPLFFVSLSIVSLSFYASIKGAKEFSSKEKEIQSKVEVSVKTYEDSLSNATKSEIDSIQKKYILPIQSEISQKKTKLDDAREQRDNLTLSNKDRRIAKNTFDEITDEIEKLESKEVEYLNQCKQIQATLKQNIDNYKLQRDKQAKVEKNENSDNSFFFVLISTLIELVILFGVYFNEYYKFRSYKEFKEKVEGDDNYQKWVNYEKVLDVIFNDDSKVNDRLPTLKLINDLVKVAGIPILSKEINDIIKLFTSIGIIRSSGNAKYLLKDKQVAKEILRKHFKIQ